MTTNYFDLINVLVSTGNIDALDALWDQISLLPESSQLKDLINRYVPQLVDILAIKLPKIKGINWRADPKTIPYINLHLNIYDNEDQLDPRVMDKISDTDLFLKLVGFYNSIILIDLFLESKSYEDVISFLVNNRTKNNTALKVYLRLLYNVTESGDFDSIKNCLYPAKERGKVFYWLIINNKDLIERRESMNSSLLKLYFRETYYQYVDDKKFNAGFLDELYREKNYYPIFALEGSFKIHTKYELTIFYIQEATVVNSYIKILNLIYTDDLEIDFLKNYLNRKDVIDRDKIELAKQLIIKSSLLLDYSSIDYDRTFHNHLLFLMEEGKYDKIVFEIIEKYGFDETYDPYKYKREDYLARINERITMLKDIKRARAANPWTRSIVK